MTDDGATPAQKITPAIPLPASIEEGWEATAVDITRLNKADPVDRQRMNSAWRALKAAAPAEAEAIRALFPKLRAHFPNAGIEVPADTLAEKDRD